ncbi:MAG TPA: HAMP domain-containing sensor histidine kinase, partial [Ktedonobacteraceae bacterium]|nr:HAMP domain-containing sensor histidine kinase [Ktedonobacteraceae bacterium]
LCMVLIIGFIIMVLRNFVDVADSAQLQAQQATQQLAIAYEQQQQLNQLKTLFILNINHELRTPLTVISGYLDILQLILQQNGHLDLTTHGPYLESAIQKCAQLGTLVNHILDTQKSDDQKEPFVFEAVSVAAAVHDALEGLISEDQKAHSISLDIPGSLTVWADIHGLHQVLHNLLSNAFKYSLPGTRIAISAAAMSDTSQEKEHTPHVCISVQDSGPGIPADEIPLLFSQFVRLRRDLAGSVRGTGLGLYISKKIVEAMGGRIWVESTNRTGEGSRFCFTLPCVPDQIMPSEAEYRQFAKSPAPIMPS